MQIGSTDFFNLVAQHVQTLGPLLRVSLLAAQRCLQFGIALIGLLIFGQQRLNLVGGKLIEHVQMVFWLHQLLMIVLPLNINQMSTDSTQRGSIDQRAIDPNHVAAIAMNLARNNQRAIITFNSQIIQ